MKRYLIVILFIVGCNSKTLKTVKIDDNTIAEGEDISDSVFNGEVKYFDKEGTLLSKAHFLNNKSNGYAIMYNSARIVVDSTFYVNNLRNGFHYGFNDKGSLTYIDYNYYNLAVGPKISYVNGHPAYYTFQDFNHHPLFTIQYDSTGIQKQYGNLINLNYRTLSLDNNDKIGLMLYLINPPLISIQYNIGIISLSDSSRNKLSTLDIHGRVFMDTALSILDKNHAYYVQADCYDSTSKHTASYFQIIENPSEDK